MPNLEGDNQACGASQTSPDGGPSKPSREFAILEKIDGRARLYVTMGVVALLAGLLLFAGLSSTPVGVAIAVTAVMGGPFLLLWDERMGRIAKQAIGVYLVVVIFWLIAFPLIHGWGIDQVGRILSWASVLLGLSFIWIGGKTLRMLPAARYSLSGPVFDVRLEIKVLRGYGGMPSTMALLWRSDFATPPLARFGWQLSEPQLVAVNKAPARVFGAPRKHAVVVVSSSEAVLVGRVRMSHFGESPPPSKPASALTTWLWKPRSLHLL